MADPSRNFAALHIDRLHRGAEDQLDARVPIEMRELVQHCELRVDRAEIAGDVRAAGRAVPSRPGGTRARLHENLAGKGAPEELVHRRVAVRPLRVRPAPREGRVVHPRAGHLHDVLGIAVVRLELFVLQGPVDADSELRPQPEVVRQHAGSAREPAVRVPAKGVEEEPLFLGVPVHERTLGRGKEGHTLVDQLLLVRVHDATLEHEHARRGRALQVTVEEERRREAGADDDQIVRLGHIDSGRVSITPLKPFFRAAGWMRATHGGVRAPEPQAGRARPPAPESDPEGAIRYRR